MVTGLTNSELGRYLLTMRSFHWMFGAQGDPYALILRAESDDRHQLGQQVREGGKLYQSSTGAWVTASRELGAAILADPRLGVRHAGQENPQHHFDQDVWGESLQMCHILPLDDAGLNLERAEYERLLRLTDPVLGATVVAERHQEEVARIFNEIVDRLDGEFDLVVDYSRAGCVAVLCRLFDIPQDRREQFAELCAELGVALDAGLCPPQLKTARRLLTAVEAVRELFDGLVEVRRAAPAGDVISTLLRGAGDGAQATADVTTACVLTTVVGVEVTVNLIANTVAGLLGHPDQWKQLCAEPHLAAAAVEEALRWDPPVRLESRIAHQDVELDGHTVPAGGHVVVLVDAANRDPEFGPDADRFDVNRGRGVDHLALGGGLHTTLVAPLARLQAQVAVRVLAERLPGIRATSEVLRRMRSPVVRGVLRFPVAVS